MRGPMSYVRAIDAMTIGIVESFWCGVISFTSESK